MAFFHPVEGLVLLVGGQAFEGVQLDTGIGSGLNSIGGLGVGEAAG